MPATALADFLNSLHRPAHILVAISGGSDSTGLLVALAELLTVPDYSDISVSAATVDHALRAESAGEAREVAALCGRLGIRHVTRRWEGFKPASGIMAAAREARYALLADIAADVSATVVVTAHTVDDQEETLAMRAARLAEGGIAAGTGIADAMLFERRIWILRPLLKCRRADIRRLLTARGIGWIEDPSNEDMHYERVRTRRHLAQEPLAVPISDMGEGRAAYSAAAAQWFDAHVTVHAGALCEIDCQGLDAEEPVLAYALSRLAAVFGGQAYGPGRDHLARILDFLRSSPSGRRTAGGVVFDLRRRGLYLMRESRGIRPLILSAGESCVWDGRFEILNGGSTAIRVGAAMEGRAVFAADLPKAAVLRASAALPKISPVDDAVGDVDHSLVAFTPYFAPFDRFLTRFDLIFADRLAASFGRTRYLPPPL
jgi:tRNA(Ile)-lysidine synthase